MKNVLHRALADTCASQLTAFIMLAIGACLSIAWLLLRRGEDVAIEEIQYVEAGLVGALGAMLLLFLWNLACAPYRIERDAHARTKRELEGLAARAETSSKRRILTSKQKNKIGTIFRKYNQEIPKLNIFHFPASEECVDFAGDIRDAIRRGRVECEITTMSHIQPDPDHWRVYFCYNPDYPKNKALSLELEGYFREIGLDAEAQEFRGNLIYVGRMKKSDSPA